MLRTTNTLWFSLAAALVALCAPAAVCPAGEDDSILYVYARSGAIAAEVADGFREKYGFRVEVEHFDSDEEMHEQIRHGETGYDLLVASSGVAEDLALSNALLEIDHKKIDNLRHVRSRALALFPDAELRYHVPFHVSVIGVGYDRKRVEANATGSWDIYARPEYRKKAAMMNDTRNALGAALKYLGHSVNSVDNGEIADAGKLVKSWKDNIALFATVEAGEMLVNGDLSFIQASNGFVAGLARQNPDLDFFVPREGSIMATDNFVIPGDSTKTGPAHAFINHMLDPAVAARNMEATFLYMPVPEARELLSGGLRNSVMFKIDEEIFFKCEPVLRIGPALELYDKTWGDVLLGRR